MVAHCMFCQLCGSLSPQLLTHVRIHAMQQFTDWSSVKALPLHVLISGTSFTANISFESLRRRKNAYRASSQVVCQAIKQRGATYYERYLRNRKEKGGEFLGPPKGPQLLLLQGQQQQQHQQQQNSNNDVSASTAAVDASHSSASSTAAVPADQQAAADALSIHTPQGFKQLLDRYLLLTAPGPVTVIELRTESPGTLKSTTLHNNVNTEDNYKIQQHHELTAQTLHKSSSAGFETKLQPQQQQQLRQPWQFGDYVASEQAAAETLRAQNRKRGLTVRRPVIASSGSPLMPLPDLPSSSSGSSSSTRTRVLHIFWDISSCHPGGFDPRVIAAHLRNVCSCYGAVAGLYAYGVAKQFSWVPEAFMGQYAPQRLPGKRKSKQDRSVEQQQQQLEAKLQSLAAAGVDLDDSLGPLRCPACGKLRSNYAQLHLHMVQRHKQPAPPLITLLPQGALDTLTAAAAASSAAAAAAGGSSRQLASWAAISSSSSGSSAIRGSFDVTTMQNNSTRTLGRVNKYYNSQGALFIPPPGHQISLKYVLLREGVDIRLVQNQKRAIDVSLADGLNQLLKRLLQRDAASAQLYEDVVVVISDRGTHSNVLQRFQKAGLKTVAVCRSIRQYKGADVTLRWQWIVNGRYDCAAASAGQA